MNVDTKQLPKLTPNINKIISAIAFVVRFGVDAGRPLTQYDIVKSLFLADKSHLNEYGRPITYDNYVAMKHGPVPSLVYDLLKGKVPRGINAEHLPWRRSVEHKQNAFEFYPAGPVEFDEHLSKSDMDALEWACETVLRLGFSGIRKLTHEHESYLNAWPSDADSGSYKMDLSLFLDEPNPALIDDLVEFSPYV